MATPPSQLNRTQLLRNLIQGLLTAHGTTVLSDAAVEEDQTTEQFILVDNQDGTYTLSQGTNATTLIV